MKLKISLFTACLFIGFQLFAQIPQGYYDRAYGKSGRELQDSLCSIIDGHKRIHFNESYYDTLTHITTYHDTCLLTMYPQTDPVRGEQGQIFDIYNACSFTPEDLGEYSEGMLSCVHFQKEHTFPAAWFNGRNMNAGFCAKRCEAYSDLFNVYPADAKANNLRRDNPYGVVNRDGAATLFSAGAALGYNVYEPPYATMTMPRSQKTAFEPLDEFKGDIARNYFYMATRYMHEDATWPTTWDSTPMFNRSQPREWALAMLLEWHFSDPVSEKEIWRNNAIYGIQGNRNPYIDHPELVTLVWGNDSAHTTFQPVLANAPVIVNCEMETANAFVLQFSEAMSIASLQMTDNYHIWPGNHTIASAQALPNNSVRIVLEESLGVGKTFKCRFQNLQNQAGTSFLRDTIVNLTYGYATPSVPLASWTFGQTYQLGRIIPADGCGIDDGAAIYFNGFHGSTNTSLANNDSLVLTTGNSLGNLCSTATTNALPLKKVNAHIVNGNSFVINCSTNNYRNIRLSFASKFTNAGFKILSYEWSTGEGYSLVRRDSLPATNDATYWYLQQVDFSSIPEMNDQDSIFIRITLDGATGTGNIALDNIFITGEHCYLDEPVVISDTVLRGEPYEAHGFVLSEQETAFAGLHQFVRQVANADDCDSLYVLRLQIVDTTHYIPTSIEETEIPQFIMYPNPASESVTLRGAGMKEVRIYNAMGQLVKTLQVRSEELTFSIGNWPSGLYVVHIVTNDNSLFSNKLLVRH